MAGELRLPSPVTAQRELTAAPPNRATAAARQNCRNPAAPSRGWSFQPPFHSSAWAVTLEEHPTSSREPPPRPGGQAGRGARAAPGRTQEPGPRAGRGAAVAAAAGVGGDGGGAGGPAAGKEGSAGASSPGPISSEPLASHLPSFPARCVACALPAPRALGPREGTMVRSGCAARNRVLS